MSENCLDRLKRVDTRFVECLSNTTPKDDMTQNDLDEEGKTTNTSSFKRRGSMT